STGTCLDGLFLLLTVGLCGLLLWSCCHVALSRVGLRSVSNYSKYVTHSDRVSFFFIDPLEHAALFCAYFDVNLIRFEFHQYITRLDSIAFLFEPLCNYGIYYGFAQCWNTNFGGHVCLPPFKMCT